MRRGGSFIYGLLSLALVDATWNIGTFLHITDVHVNLRYSVGSAANCALEGTLVSGCCTTDSVSMSPAREAGVWGDYNCDAPLRTVEAGFAWMANNLPTPNFIVWTGDSPDHRVWEQSWTENFEATSNVTALFKQYFPGVRVLPAIGNHDAFPINQLGEIDDDTGVQPVLSAYSELWADWLEDEVAISSFAEGGYYSVPVDTNLRVVALNGLWYEVSNLDMIGEPTVDDVRTKQMVWLRHQFVDAASAGDKLLVIVHQPAGSLSTTQYYSSALQTELVAGQAMGSLMGVLAGHSHNDEFSHLRPGPCDPPVVTQLIAPSFTPLDLRMSAFRSFNYTRSEPNTPAVLLDYAEYGADLTEANAGATLERPGQGPEFRLMFGSVLQQNKMADLSSASWDVFMGSMIEDQAIFDSWYNMRAVGDVEVDTCDATCSIPVFCNLAEVTGDAVSACIQAGGAPAFLAHYNPDSPCTAQFGSAQGQGFEDEAAELPQGELPSRAPPADGSEGAGGRSPEGEGEQEVEGGEESGADLASLLQLTALSATVAVAVVLVAREHRRAAIRHVEGLDGRASSLGRRGGGEEEGGGAYARATGSDTMPIPMSSFRAAGDVLGGDRL